EVYKAVLSKLRMQRDAEQAALGSVVDGEIERRAVQDTVNDSLHFASRLFQNEEIVWTDEGHAGRLIEPGDHGADGEIVVQHDWQWSSGLNQRRRRGCVVIRIRIAFVGRNE